MNAFFRMNITCTDGTFNSTAELLLKIVDENDNRPRFTLRRDKTTFTLSQFMDSSIEVYHADALDKDAGVYGKVLYR